MTYRMALSFIKFGPADEEQFGAEPFFLLSDDYQRPPYEAMRPRMTCF